MLVQSRLLGMRESHPNPESSSYFAVPPMFGLMTNSTESVGTAWMPFSTSVPSGACVASGVAKTHLQAICRPMNQPVSSVCTTPARR